LVHVTNHLVALERKKADVSGQLNSLIKHYKKLAKGLAEAIKFKSELPLEQELGMTWEHDIEEIKSLENFEIQ